MDKLNLNKKELDIVQFLFEHEDQFHSSQSIADYIQVSSRTVRKYINSINAILEDFGAVIEMKKGSGYQLIINSHRQFYQFIDLIREQKRTFEHSNLLIDNNSRERFILNALLLENKEITILDLVDEMYVSRSTISTVIQSIKQRLDKFELNLSYDPEGNIVINGEELSKRRFILNYFFSSSSLDRYVNTDLIEFQYEGFSVETIFIIVLENCREYDIQLSDFVLQNLVLHIALAIKRNEKGFVINKVNVDDGIEYSKELFVSEKIVTSIEKLIDIEFSQNEAKYIALHLKSKSNNRVLKDNIEEASDLSLENQIVNVLMQLRTQKELLFSMDQQLVMGLKLHLKPLLTRLQLDINLKNPLLNEIKEKYKEIFNLTKKYFSLMPILSKYRVDDHEWAYISLHLLAAVERYKQKHKVNVVVICATGLGSAQMLKNRLENEFSANINIVNVISYYQLNDEILKNVDLIVTTIDISTSFYNIPIVKVSVFLTQNDVDLLNKHINHFTLMKEETTDTNVKYEQLNHLFHQYFNDKRFIVFESLTTKENVLNKMIQALTDAEETSFNKDLRNQILMREQFGTLAFTETVAFPHPAQPIGINSEIVIGLVPKGVQWDDEHSHVKMIVLMSPSKIENKGLDLINSGLAEFIDREKNIELTLKHASFEQFEQLFMETLTK